MSFGLNVVTVALMLTVFASTAGLTGGEVAIAGGSVVLGQKLLETIFGEDTVRRMVTQARNDLNERLGGLFAAERDRYHVFTDPLLEGATAEQIRDASQQARRAVDAELLGVVEKQAPARIDDTTPDNDLNNSTLRGLFDQLRGNFRKGSDDGAV